MVSNFQAIRHRSPNGPVTANIARLKIPGTGMAPAPVINTYQNSDLDVWSNY